MSYDQSRLANFIAMGCGALIIIAFILFICAGTVALWQQLPIWLGG